MRLFSKWWDNKEVRADEEAMMDFLPITDGVDHATKLAKARERHGKPFRTDAPKMRETENSRDLIDLINASESAKTKAEREEAAKRIINVRQINRGGR